MDTDYIFIFFGGYGMMIIWGPFGQPQFLTVESIENDISA